MLVDQGSFRMPILPLILALGLGASVPWAFAEGSSTDGANDLAWGEDSWDQPEEGLAWSGFVEALAGGRIHNNPVIASDNTVADIRVRLEASRYWGNLFFSAKGDVWYDGTLTNLTGELMDLSLSGQLGDQMDIKAGRFVSTWGTGDLLFLNDLFPKDWESFFAGREMDYLKRAANSLKLGYFTSALNVDFVWTPVFEPDNTLDGQRFSYFSPFTGQETAAPPRMISERPQKKAGNGEFGLRLSRKVDSVEWATYLWRGYFKQPLGYDLQLGLPYYPRLNSLGGSVQGNVLAGIFNVEMAWYHSEEDTSGIDPLVPNSQVRFLVGYQQEVVPRLTGAVQWYAEWTLDHDALLRNSLAPQWEPDEWRQVLSMRLTQRMMRDNLILSLMSLYSPTDNDFFVLPSVSYRFSDSLSTELGGRFLGGEEGHTFYGQHRNNSSLYARFRARI